MCVQAVYVVLAWIVAAAGNPCFFWDTSLYHDGYCYKLGTVLSNWSDAQTFCGRNVSQARLAEPVTAVRLEYLAKAVILSGEDWWIGGIIAQGIAVWSSTGQPIQSGNISKYFYGTCVQLTDSKKDLLVPVMSTNACPTKLKCICQLYVGDPCRDSFPGSEYCNDGSCYKLHNASVHWEEALTTCNRQGSKLAEFYSNDSYYYVKKRIQDRAANEVFLAPNSTVYLESYNTTLSNTSGYFSFRLLTCGNLKLSLWAEKSATSLASLSPIGGSTNEYYTIEYGVSGTIQASFKYCNKTSCSTLVTGYGTAVNCSKFIAPVIVWNYEAKTIWVSDAKLWLNFTATEMTMLLISRVGVSTENGSALFVFADSVSSSDIHLGGSDVQQEGLFTWLSTNITVAIDDWLPGEPNDWSTDLGEDHLGWRFSGSSMGLNDLNGTTRLARPLCQKDALLVTYLIVLPESDASENKTPEVHVTSEKLEVVYLHFTQRWNTGETTLSYDWVTSYRNVIFGVGSGVELRDTAIYHGLVVLKVTNYVTVVLYQTSAGHIGTTLVFPVHPVTSGYFVLTNASQESGSHITVTAFADDTDVTVKLPRAQRQPFTVTINGFIVQQISRTGFHLDEFDTAHIQSMDDFSGSFVYSTKPIVVYSGSKYVQTKATSGDNMLDMAIPVDTLGTKYVTTTFGASTAGGTVTNDKFRLLALYDDTVVTVSGASITNVTLAKAGSITDILLPAGAFYVMNSDPYHPFYVTKLTLTSDGACTTSLLPDALWRSQYDLYVKYDQLRVAFVVEKNSLSSFLIDGNYNSTYLRPCADIAGTGLIGCNMNLDRGLHHIGFNESRVKFMAYSSQTFSTGIEFCHALGSSHWVNNSQEPFKAVEYINLKDTEPFPPPNLPETTTAEATTSSQSTAEHTTEPDSSEETSHGQYTTIESSGNITATVPTTSTSEPSTTTTTTQANKQSSTSTSEITSAATASSVPTGGFAQQNVSKCLPFNVPQLNLSKQELDSITQGIERFLLINIRDTSAFRQKLQCTWDYRPSCHVIGVSGVVIITCFISLFISSDFVNIFRWIISSDNKVKNQIIALK